MKCVYLVLYLLILLDFAEQTLLPACDKKARSELPGKFYLIPQPLKCPNPEQVQVVAELDHVQDGWKAPPTQPRLLTSGYLRTGDGKYLSSENYCVRSSFRNSDSGNSTSTWTIEYCVPEKRYLLPKCCPPGKLVTITQTFECRDALTTDTFSPYLYDAEGKGRLVEQASFLPAPLPKCGTRGFTSVRRSASCFRIGEDAVLSIVRDNAWTRLNSVPFCFDGVQTLNGSLFYGREEDFVVIACAEAEDGSEDQTLRKLIYGVVMLVASVFPFAALIIYLLLWKDQNIHGWIRMGFFGTNSVMYFLFSMQHLAWDDLILQTDYPEVCITIGVATHFFWLSTFAWLTVIAYNIFAMLRSIFDRNLKSKRKFFYGSAFGWGLPLVLVGISLGLDVTIGSDPCNTFVVPHYGKKICYVAPHAADFYIYYPMLAFLLINLGLYIASMVLLYRAKKGISSVLCVEAASVKRQMFKTCVKICFIVGITWILEYVSWKFGGASGNATLWICVDVLVLLQSILVSVLLAGNSKVVKQLQLRFPRFHRRVRKLSNFMGINPPPFDSRNTSKNHTPITSLTSVPLSIHSSQSRNVE